MLSDYLGIPENQSDIVSYHLAGGIFHRDHVLFLLGCCWFQVYGVNIHLSDASFACDIACCEPVTANYIFDIYSYKDNIGVDERDSDNDRLYKGNLNRDTGVCKDDLACCRQYLVAVTTALPESRFEYCFV